MKEQVEAAARQQGVRPAVVIRWSLEDWLRNNGPEVTGSADGSDRA